MCAHSSGAVALHSHGCGIWRDVCLIWTAERALQSCHRPHCGRAGHAARISHLPDCAAISNHCRYWTLDPGHCAAEQGPHLAAAGRARRRAAAEEARHSGASWAHAAADAAAAAGAAAVAVADTAAAAGSTAAGPLQGCMLELTRSAVRVACSEGMRKSLASAPKYPA